MSDLKESFSLVMAIESGRDSLKKHKAEKERWDGLSQKEQIRVEFPTIIKEKLVVALEQREYSYRVSRVIELDEEDLEYLYKKHKAKLKDHLLKSL